MPLSLLQTFAVKTRWAVTHPYHSKLPVICIGNFTMGGAGKTPMALFLAKYLKEQGQRPIFLTRGYGGQIQGPHLVTEKDIAQDVGDEPLLLARQAPCVVCANRQKGAQFIETLNTYNPSIIVMDDGFQNPTLYKDLNIIVVDTNMAFGNGLVFPAGPLRAPLDFQIQKADLFVIIHQKTPSPLQYQMDQPVCHAALSPCKQKTTLQNKNVIAFCGIARPEKFYTTLHDMGADPIQQHSFPDHHNLSAGEAEMLLLEATSNNARLVTTEKDWVRLSDKREPFSSLKSEALPIKVSLFFDDDNLEILTNSLRAIY